MNTYTIEIKHGIDIKQKQIKAASIDNLRKNLMKTYRTFSDIDVILIAVFKDMRYVGTMYIFYNPPVYQWYVNPKNPYYTVKDSTKIYKIGSDGKIRVKIW